MHVAVNALLRLHQALAQEVAAEQYGFFEQAHLGEHDAHAVELGAVRAAGGPDAELAARAEYEWKEVALQELELLRVPEEPGDDHRHRLAEAVAGWVIRHEQARQLIHVLEALPLERATHPLGHVLLPIREEVHPAREREPAQGLGGLFQRRRHRPGNRPRHPHP